MATSKKKKKVVSKDDLRRLMKEKKATVATTKRIEHQFAKYNSVDQLVCVICNTVIKSGQLWPSHLQSRQHKEKLTQVKPAVDTFTTGVKRGLPQQSNSHEDSKRLRGNGQSAKSSTNSGLPSDFFDNKSQDKASMPTTKRAGLASYSSSSSEDEAEVTPKLSTATVSSVPGLPADFFNTSTSSKQEEIEKPKTESMADVLPEGFFDDPKTDAKVRKVEYKDKMDEEWEMFRRAMKEENHVSEAIMDEEDEQANVDRNIDEIDDQMNRWNEINKLQIKKEEIMSNQGSKDVASKSDSDEDAEDQELQEFMDWRSKKSWK
ncbi:zinc finger protein 830-like [Mizuhopecten yessoensis]|uniref:Zinc finger protein 830 n=1 Tax=Mizuhopecten yessoensis TaxID=6573 RepID=A0A210PIF7_MIZYE|nr:zinc finger protein 830-like [Mizuhopecten yessoensis]OWF36265.1 Zinc finger protein 830 [Mizuhopecten yessoensis]